jgi:RHS repeat-associated protein
MWNYINGLGWKVTNYAYNSQNQITVLEYQNDTDSDYKRFVYFYDYAGRMHAVSTEESGPPPDYNYPFAVYKYNENSQIDSLLLNNLAVGMAYTFNSRNWITECDNSNQIFGYTLDYLKNGNICSQYLPGSYRSYFNDIKEVKSQFSYDKSNRLIKTERNSSKYFNLEGNYAYDYDGNFISLTRSYNGDNFNYQYYAGTNRLRSIAGPDEYTYDYNGNMTNDYFNNNVSIKYDHRNLITEIQNIASESLVYLTQYKYDEAGNRTRKTVYRSDYQPPPPIEEGDNPGLGWETIKDEYYSRDVSGKEIAVYQSSELDFWNVWGSGNEGRIKSNGSRYYYLKDHLGSIRAVIDESNNLVEAQDYDPWGHIARQWTSNSTLYKFTGKERDIESNYDYFGARYYDARVGRWGQMEPLYDKYINFSPYIYSFSNTLIFKDINGLDVIIHGDDAQNAYKNLN